MNWLQERALISDEVPVRQNGPCRLNGKMNPDQHSRLLDGLRSIVPHEAIITEPSARAAFESDGLTAMAVVPPIVVLPETTTQVSAILKLLPCPRSQGRAARRGYRPFRWCAAAD